MSAQYSFYVVILDHHPNFRYEKAVCHRTKPPLSIITDDDASGDSGDSIINDIGLFLSASDNNSSSIQSYMP
jgi:hypothetical protein